MIKHILTSIIVLLSTVTVTAASANTGEPTTQCDEIIIEQMQGYAGGYDVPLSEGRQLYVKGVCERFNVSYELVLGIMNAESSFNPDAVNGDSIGIMQVNLINLEQYQDEFDKLGIWDLGNFYQNVQAGVFLLSQIEAETTAGKLMIYNCGQSGAEKLFNQGIHTSEYAEKVIEYAVNL